MSVAGRRPSARPPDRDASTARRLNPATLVVLGLLAAGIGFVGASIDPGAGPKTVRGSLTVGPFHLPPLLTGLVAIAVARLAATRIRHPDRAAHLGAPPRLTTRARSWLLHGAPDGRAAPRASRRPHERSRHVDHRYAQGPDSRAAQGSGPPLLRLHGFPQTLAMWRDVAPILAEHFTVVCADLRGYGASACAPSADDHAPYSKRALAADMVAVMAELGFERFSIAGHEPRRPHGLPRGT